MAELLPETRWSEAPLWRTPTVLQTTLTVTLVGPRSMASIDCLTISGDDPLAIEAWSLELVGFDELVTRCIDTLRAELKCQLGNVSPF